MSVCPTCKSNRCGNYAACARNKEENIENIRSELNKIALETEKRTGRRMTSAEMEDLAKRYMVALSEELAKQRTP